MRRQNSNEERIVGLGLLFLAAVEEATKKVLANPEAFQPVSDEIRHKLISRFPYSLLYVIEPDRIRIIAVAHQKRRPGYWSRRL